MKKLVNLQHRMKYFFYYVTFFHTKLHLSVEDSNLDYK